MYFVSFTEKISFWGERKDYWHYMTEDLQGMRELSQSVKSIQAKPEVSSLLSTSLLS